MTYHLLGVAITTQVTPGHGVSVYVARDSSTTSPARMAIVEDAIHRQWIPRIALEDKTIIVDYKCDDLSGDLRSEFEDMTGWGTLRWDMAKSTQVCWFTFSSCNNLRYKYFTAVDRRVEVRTLDQWEYGCCRGFPVFAPSPTLWHPICFCNI